MSMTPVMMQSQAMPILRCIMLARLIVCCTLCSASEWKIKPKKLRDYGKSPALVSLLFMEVV